MTVSLVTGGAGFIGSHVVDHLIQMGHMVVVLDDLSGGSLKNLFMPDSVTLHVNTGSILDVKNVEHLFEEHKPDYVFHLAAYAAENLSHHIRRYNYETNVIGSVNLINAAVNAGTVRRFVFTSSAAVYGHSGRREDARVFPVDPYGIAKYAVELDLAAAGALFALPYTVFRMHNVYGERQNLADGYRNAIGIFLRQALLGESLTVFGDGTQSRQFTHVDDVAPYLARCIDVPAAANRTINIGSDRSATVNEIASDVINAVGLTSVIDYLPARHEVSHVHLLHDVFREIFGEHETVSTWDGIARMAAWARTQTLGSPKPFAGIEIEKNLPESWRVNEHR